MVSFLTRRRVGAVLTGAATAILTGIRPAFAYNCVNVVLRDPFWGQFRRIIESGSNAVGVPSALARNGFQVDGSPSVGAVISWPAGQYGASGVGHVGVVTAVHGDGTVQILHENWPYGAPAHLKNVVVRPGMLFVHVPAPVAETEPEELAPAV
jgi:hypothetical protein